MEIRSNFVNRFTLKKHAIPYGPLFLGILGLSFLLVYTTIFFKISFNWTFSEKIYAFIILIISVYMVFLRFTNTQISSLEPSLFFGALIASSGCLIFLIGKQSNTVLMVEFSLLPILLGFTLLLAGIHWFRILIIPTFYMLFAFPIPMFLFDKYAYGLQLATADIASFFLRLFGFPVFQNREFILLPHINLQVANVCSGTNHIVALLGLAIPIAYLTQKSFRKQILLIFLAIPLAVFLNGLRVAFIGIWIHFSPKMSVHGPFNVLLISVFVVGFGAAILLFLSYTINGSFSKVRGVKYYFKEQNIRENHPARYWKHKWSIYISIMILFATLLHIQFMKPVSISLTQDLDFLPETIGNWNRANYQSPLVQLVVDGNEVPNFHATYQNRVGMKTSLAMFYFKDQNSNPDIFRVLEMIDETLTTDSGAQNSSPISASGSFRSLNFSDNDLTHYYFLFDDQVITDRIKLKRELTIDSLLRKKNNVLMLVFFKSVHSATDSYKISDFIKKILNLTSEFSTNYIRPL